MKDKKIGFIDILILGCLYFAGFASLYSDALNRVALYVAMPFAFIITLLKNRGLRANKYFYVITVLLGWVSLSYFWATYEEAAAREIHAMLGTFLVGFLFCVNAKNYRMIGWLYVTYFFIVLSVWLYVRSNLYGMLSETNSRLGDDKLNTNTIAYYLFYITFIIYVLPNLIKKHKNIRRTLWLAFLAMIPFTFVIALVTASRQVLIVQIPLIATLLYMRYYMRASVRQRAIFIFVSIIASCIAIPIAMDKYSGSYLQTRSETKVKEDSRFELVEDAISVGNKAFPIGVGAGNYVKLSYRREFAHNTYLELYANAGLIAVMLYIGLVGMFIVRQWKRFRRTNDTMYLTFLLFGLIYILDGFFYVFYDSLWLMGFFLLVASHSETYYNKHKLCITY